MREIHDLTVGIVGDASPLTEAWLVCLAAAGCRRFLVAGGSEASAATMAPYDGVESEVVESDEQLLERRPDGVVVVADVDPAGRARLAMRALGSGCSVLADAPLLTWSEQWALRAAAESGLPGHEAHLQSPMLAGVVDRLRDGAIGELESIKLTWWLASYHENAPADFGAGALAVLREVVDLGEVTAVRNHAAPGRGVVLLEHPSVDVTLDVASGILGIPAELVHLSLRGSLGSVEVPLRTPRTPEPDLVPFRPKLSTRADGGVEHLPAVPDVGGAMLELARRWVDTLRGGEDRLRTGLAATLENRRLLEAAMTSGQADGQRIVLDPRA